MKPFQKQNRLRRQAVQPEVRAVPPAPAPPPAAVHRYVHPIQTSRPAASPPAEELLADVLETLSRQSDKLDEILRYLQRDNSDTL